MLQTLFMEKLTITPFEQHGQTVHRIVDQDGHLIAKVNGPRNLSICRRMVEVFNRCQDEDVDRMKSLLRNRLLDIVRNLPNGSMWGRAARLHLEADGDPDELIQSLKSQMQDNPPVMVSAIGGEAVQILQVL